MKAFVAMVLSSSLSTGCATRYQPMGFGGGYSESSLSPGIMRVYVRGNGFSSPERIEDFALLRAAESCLERGQHHFVVIGENASSVVGGGDIVFSKPTSSMMVKCLGESGDGRDALDADSVRSSLRAKYGL